MEAEPAPISVVIPAHNEAMVIGRLLSALLADANPGELELIVVANGCTDTTAAVAESFGDGVTVLTTPVAAKHAALRLGDKNAHHYPRLYVDADVVLSTDDVRALAAELRKPGVLAAAPRRSIALARRPLVVRWYYDFWQKLPSVEQGLFGRGVIGVSATGHARLAAMPEVMGDDLAASVAYTADERRIVTDASVTVHAPRTVGDLVNRRVRSLTATAQLRQSMPEAVGDARTRGSDLFRLAQRRPALTPKLGVFLAVTVVSRLKARGPIRSGDFTTWLRDESSRSGG